MAKTAQRAKRLLFIIVALNITAAISIFSTAVYLALHLEQLDLARPPHLYAREFRMMLYAAMSGAALILLSACLLCYAACKASQLALSLCLCFYFVLFGFTSASAALSFIYEIKILKEFGSALDSSVRIFTSDNSVEKLGEHQRLPVLAFLDKVQSQLKCCGVNSSSDYLQSNDAAQHLRIPHSCCDRRRLLDCSKFDGPRQAFVKGCRTEFHKFLNAKFTILKMLIICVAILMLITLTVNQLICCIVRNPFDSKGESSVYKHHQYHQSHPQKQQIALPSVANNQKLELSPYAQFI